MAPVSLLEQVQGLLERTYAMTPGLVEAGRFVIGDNGYARLYGRKEIVEVVDTGEPNRARTLLYQADGTVRASLYYPDAMIRQLEKHPPRRGLRDENVEPFSVLVEELDHLLVMAQRIAEGRPASLFELELHANVSKHLVLTRFLSRHGGRPAPARAAWLRDRLFHRPVFDDEREPVRNRYRDAARYGFQFLRRLERTPSRDRLSVLRRFHRRSVAGKLELIRSLAAA